MQFDEWCRQLDTFLNSRQRGIRVTEMGPDFLLKQFQHGLAPVQVATSPSIPRRVQCGSAADALAVVVSARGNANATFGFGTHGASTPRLPKLSNDRSSRSGRGVIMQGTTTTTGGLGMYHSGGGWSAGGYAGQSVSNLARHLAPPSLLDSSRLPRHSCTRHGPRLGSSCLWPRSVTPRKEPADKAIGVRSLFGLVLAVAGSFGLFFRSECAKAG